MVSRQLMSVWVFFDFCLLAAGAVTLALSIVWRAPNLLMNLVFSENELTAGLTLAVALLVTFVISVAAVVQRNHVTVGLKMLNWALILDSIFVVIIGSILWFGTLRMRDNYRTIYAAQTPEIRIMLQDKLQCCGYFNASDLVEFSGNFCRDPAFLTTPEFLGADNGTSRFCVDPITAFADTTMMNAFTTIYGYMGIIIGLFLASLCVINKRLEGERFKKIDLKRGGRGFV